MLIEKFEQFDIFIKIATPIILFGLLVAIAGEHCSPVENQHENHNHCIRTNSH